MNKSAFFLAVLVTIAFCSSSKAVSYDSVLNKLVQLNQAIGKDKSDIALLISQVSQAVKEEGEKFDSFISGMNQSCGAGEKLLDGFIGKLEGDKTSAQAASVKADQDNKAITSEREKHTSDLAAAKDDLDKLKAQIAKTVENFKVEGAEAEEKLVVIKVLKDIITDELLASEHVTSFVQLHTFNDKLRQLNSLMIKSKDTTYTPLVATLLQLAQVHGFADQKILGQIMNVLTKLEGNLKEFRKKQNTDGKANIESLKARAEEKIKQIRSIAIMVAEGDSEYLDNENISKNAAQEIDAVDREIERKQLEMRFWKKICDFQVGLQTKDKDFRDKFDSLVKSVGETFTA